MNVFHKRPLSLILCIMLGGFFIFTVATPVLKIILSCTLAVVFIASFVLAFRIRPKKIFYVCLFVLVLSFIASHLYFGNYFYVFSKYQDRINVKGQVSYVEDKDTCTDIYLNVTHINEDEISQRKLLVKCYSDTDGADSGDIISISAKIKNYDSVTNQESFYTSKGISGVALVDYVTVVSSGETTLEGRFQSFRKQISDYSIKLCGKEAGGFISALLLGEVADMNPVMAQDFQRTGITHVLALSGTHLTILCGGLGLLLARLRVDKRIISVFTILFCIFYMLLVGMPTSIVRAGIMFIIASLLFLILGCRDGITNLFMAISLIILFSPYAILDIGLWLSALATFGLILASLTIRKSYDTSAFYIKAGKALLVSLYYSVFAIVATTAVSALAFSTTSWFAAPATLVFGILTEIYLYVSLLVLPLGLIFPQASIVLTPLYELQKFLAAKFSAIPGVYTSTQFEIVEISAIAATAALALFAILKIKRKKLFISVIALLLVLNSSLSAFMTYRAKYEDSVLFSTESSDKFIVNSEGSCAVIEFWTDNNFFETVSLAEDSGAPDVDVYICMNYAYGIDEHIYTTLLYLRPEKVVLPLPRNVVEDDIATKIYGLTIDFGAKIDFYRQGIPYYVGEIGFISASRSILDEGSPYCASIFETGNTLHGYISSGALDRCNEAYEMLYVCESLIFGSCGTQEDNKILSSVSDKLKEVIICNDSIYLPERAEFPSMRVYDYKGKVKYIEGKKLIRQ